MSARNVVIAATWFLRGRVQGVGARPAIARRAQELGIAGSVRNTLAGLVVRVEGSPEAVDQLRRELTDHLLPAPARLDQWEESAREPDGATRFEIVQDEPAAGGSVSTQVPRDVAVCDTCLEEFSSPDNRRAGYPLITCARCGPRYSLIEAMPFERPRTTMRNFPLCARCQAEYDSPQDRRFHAQTITCAECGPAIWLTNASGSRLAANEVALEQAGNALRQGSIVALRGVGGYQLLCDATDDEVVRRLRTRKGRDGKPLAVLVRSLEQARTLGVINPGSIEERTLRDAANPIVLVSRRADAGLAPSVAPGLDAVGLLLPTTGLHERLIAIARRPLVCTSANREGEPLEFVPERCQERLAGVADVWLHHDRPISCSIDDSVVRMIAGHAVPIRLARGLAPWPLNFPHSRVDETGPLLAVGGHQKSAIAWHNGSQAALGQHLGDLDTVATRERWTKYVAATQQLYQFQPAFVVGDAHPDYFTTQWSRGTGGRVLSVQHHFAHLAAAMLDHELLDRQVLGVTWDGTGWGPDGTIWGGEFLLADGLRSWRRVAHLRPFPLLGGELAIREPWRLGLALLDQAVGDAAPEIASRLWPDRPVTSLYALLRRGRPWPMTSSVGRLFDAVASLALGCDVVGFEGEAAMLWEAVADRAELAGYTFPLGSGPDAELDWRPLVRELVADQRNGITPAMISARFHRALARSIAAVSRLSAGVPVALSGGVFQNRRLVECTLEEFGDSSTGAITGIERLHTPRRIPPNDAGLAAGQLAIAVTMGDAAFSQDQERTRHVSGCAR